MPLSPLEYLRHVLDEADYLIRQTKGLEPEQFMQDETAKRAFVRSIEVIGEATKEGAKTTKGAIPGGGVAGNSQLARQADSRLFGGRLRDRLGCGEQQGSDPPYPDQKHFAHWR